MLVCVFLLQEAMELKEGKMRKGRGNDWEREGDAEKEREGMKGEEWASL